MLDRPTRYDHTCELLRQFTEDFFDQNPLSSLSLVSTSHGAAWELSRLSGHRATHV